LPRALGNRDAMREVTMDTQSHFVRRFFEDKYFQKRAAIESEEPAQTLKPWPAELWRRITAQALASDKLAKKSYDNLLHAGVRCSEALLMLVGMAATAPERGRKQDALSGSGKSAKTLAYFPNRLRSVAHEIEKLNKHSLLRPDTWVSDQGFSELEERIFRKWFVRLPVLLSRYADFLVAQSKDLKRFSQVKARPKAQACSWLIDYVREETGKPMLNDIANLLNAVAGIAGTDRTVDPPTLKQLDSRKRKKTKHIHGLHLSYPS
jgi:hypothetical protein